MYSNRPAASIVVTELVAEQHLTRPEGKRRLNEAGLQVIDVVAQQIADQVDILLGKGWSRREGAFMQDEPKEEIVATCSCGSGIPIQKFQIKGQEVILVAVPVIFQNFLDAQKAPSDETLTGIMDMVKIYNGIEPADELDVRQAVAEAYQVFWNKKQVAHA